AVLPARATLERLPATAPAGAHRREFVLSGRKVVLWRHGRTGWNAQHRFQGHSDVPLDPVGVAQARAAAAVLARLGPSKIVSSDLQRARHTAQALADLVQLPVG